MSLVASCSILWSNLLVQRTMETSIVTENVTNHTTTQYTEMYMYNTIERSLLVKSMYVVAGGLGIPGNVMTIIVILSSAQLRTKPGWYTFAP